MIFHICGQFSKKYLHLLCRCVCVKIPKAPCQALRHFHILMLDLAQHIIFRFVIAIEGAAVHLRLAADILDRNIIIVLLLAELHEGLCKFLPCTLSLFQILCHTTTSK